MLQACKTGVYNLVSGSQSEHAFYSCGVRLRNTPIFLRSRALTRWLNPRACRSRAFRVHAIATEVPVYDASTNEQEDEMTYEFCCPICLDTKLTVTKSPVGQGADLSCARCRRNFVQTTTYTDLTVTSGATPTVYQQRTELGKEVFRSPLVSFAYERGWRQSFRTAGFPGPDREFEMAMNALTPAYGQVLVDMSCGSGLFTRRFINSGKFQGVVGADFSENMLRQTQQFISDEGSIKQSDYCLLRADVARLPFRTGSVAGMHAGAAIHCWPNPQAAMAEISRVLKPGGVLVASTFMTALAPLGQLLGDDLIRPASRAVDSLLDGRRAYMKLWEEVELRELAGSVGLTDFQRERSARFILFSARKPQ